MNALVESGCGRFRNGIGCDIIRHAPRPQLAVDGHRAVEREDSMSVRLGLVLVAASSSAGAQVLSEKNISIKMALVIAETALNQCTPRVSVAVLDRAGRLRVFLQGDGASPHNLELARRKAYTALTFRRTSADWAKRTAEGDVTGQRSLADVIPLGGGVPIMIGEEAIGSVGLSGAPGGQPMEEACAKAGIAKVQDQLK
ncbi:MAG: hypothetical protein DMG19_16430 [Acidobacteria bacterium]|nr:MAG: hypothetical protein DMG19_16430 [Acidobacteriota bacterium]